MYRSFSGIFEKSCFSGDKHMVVIALSHALHFNQIATITMLKYLKETMLSLKKKVN